MQSQKNKKPSQRVENISYSGIIDCINGNNVYEFKCVSKLQPEYIIQLALYKYLYESNRDDNTVRNYYLYNILSDELWTFDCSCDNLKEMAKHLITKNSPKYVADELFKLNATNIRNKYFL